jgi:acyl carrier protein
VSAELGGRVLTTTEAAVLRMWTDLGIRPSSADQDFFDLGGRSLTLIRFLARVQEEYGVELPVDRLFEADLTVPAAAAAIEETQIGLAGEAELAAAMSELGSLSEDEIQALIRDSA